jgi:nitrogen fixation protein NifU and related proteins
MDLERMYQEIILDHYKNPLNKGLGEPFDVEVHHNNPTCGDEITLRVHVSGDQVSAVTWNGLGCSISQASASVMSDLVTGKSIDEALSLNAEFLDLMHSKGSVAPNEETLEDAAAFAGVAKYPARIKCALLGWMAFKDAVSQTVDQR